MAGRHGDRWVRPAFVLGLGLTLAACAHAPNVTTPPAGSGFVLAIAPPSFETLGVSRRWQASDIYQYQVSLRRWDGTGFAELSPPVSLLLPQKGEARHEARFTNLRHGDRYRVEVLAQGNVGGTAPDGVLNAEVPCRVEFDLAGGQDVESERWQQVSVRLDPVPFSGTLTLRPMNVPGFISRFSVALRDSQSGETRYAGQFVAKQTMTLTNLRAGIPYKVLLEAYRANGNLYRKAESEVVRFEPTADALEQQRTLVIAF